MPQKYRTHCTGGCGRLRVAGADFFTEKRTGLPRPKCKRCMTNDAQRWNKENPEKHREIYRRCNHRANLKKRFGLTEEEFARMFASADVCEICRNPEKRARRLSLDHCHNTGVIRGFLCSRCNLIIGNAKDDPDLLEKAAMYLRAYRKKEDQR